jgi:hypothetical protein
MVDERRVTVLGLVGGALGGRHRASPIHRRRAGRVFQHHTSF